MTNFGGVRSDLTVLFWLKLLTTERRKCTIRLKAAIGILGATISSNTSQFSAFGDLSLWAVTKPHFSECRPYQSRLKSGLSAKLENGCKTYAYRKKITTTNNRINPVIDNTRLIRAIFIGANNYSPKNNPLSLFKERGGYNQHYI